jgi:predicted branched-subunit amino acid permease
MGRNWLAYTLLAVGFILMLFHLIPTMYVILIGGVAGLIYALFGVKGVKTDGD